jgi:hypothetical protein
MPAMPAMPTMQAVGTLLVLCVLSVSSDLNNSINSNDTDPNAEKGGSKTVGELFSELTARDLALFILVCLIIAAILNRVRRLSHPQTSLAPPPHTSRSTTTSLSCSSNLLPK